MVVYALGTHGGVCKPKNEGTDFDSESYQLMFGVYSAKWVQSGRGGDIPQTNFHKVYVLDLFTKRSVLTI